MPYICYKTGTVVKISDEHKRLDGGLNVRESSTPSGNTNLKTYMHDGKKV